MQVNNTNDTTDVPMRVPNNLDRGALLPVEPLGNVQKVLVQLLRQCRFNGHELSFISLLEVLRNETTEGGGRLGRSNKKMDMGMAVFGALLVNGDQVSEPTLAHEAKHLRLDSLNKGLTGQGNVLWQSTIPLKGEVTNEGSHGRGDGMKP